VSASILEKIALLGEFDGEDRAALADLLLERSLRSGQVCFSEGEQSEGLVLVASGAVKLESRRAGALGEVEAGGWLGGVSLVIPGEREVTATASRDTRTLEMDRTAFRRLVEDAPRTACRLLEAIVRDLGSALRPTLDQLAAGTVDPTGADA
jgi:CRP-like cAMP-binding protein